MIVLIKKNTLIDYHSYLLGGMNTTDHITYAGAIGVYAFVVALVHTVKEFFQE